MKVLLIAFFALSFCNFALADSYKGMCKQHKCHKKKSDDKKACWAEKKACQEKAWSEKMAKFSSKGLKASKKEKLEKRMIKKIEMMKAHRAHLDEMIVLAEKNLSDIKGLKTK